MGIKKWTFAILNIIFTIVAFVTFPVQIAAMVDLGILNFFNSDLSRSILFVSFIGFVVSSTVVLMVIPGLVSLLKEESWAVDIKYLQQQLKRPGAVAHRAVLS